MAIDFDYRLASGLPQPALTFTLPSLHDGLTLDCRVYHPQSLVASPRSPPWRKHAAVIAHPYAPLGGSYDDPIVDIVASTLLRTGLLVATFNFRGAHGSAGRTSWTAKAERDDYMSVVGFVFHYVHYLDPFRPSLLAHIATSYEGHLSPPTSPGPLGRTLSDLPSPSPPQTDEVPILLLGGYSYGSMITCHLPTIGTILAPFNTPTYGSSAAEIRLRAQHLAEKENIVLASARAAAVDRQSGRSHRKGIGMRIGGDEENRASHDSKRSFSLDPEDRIRKGVAELVQKAKNRRKSRHINGEHVSPNGAVTPNNQENNTHAEPAHDCLLPVPNTTTPRMVYILVSPLQGMITNFATMSLSVSTPKLSWKAWTRPPSKSGKAHLQPEDPDIHPEKPLAEAEDKLVHNPTLAVYGDRDGFVAARKLRDWASRLERVPGSQFRAHEVSGAGHFWTQGKAAYIMRDAIKAFVEDILKDTAS
ncbi:Alpha/Beta hydrolase protein [Cercophora scortea]|uniref:Alpha/Beta hydrolase protein n=1 Tax=Cercophora scortea TaxID=314031 RepID=A0AAE0M5W8_9PEZI|nr:Alpha/Beta hydrolase protein [Cercophora scortea]